MHRLTRLVAVAAVVLGAAWLLGACGDDTTSEAGASGLASKAVEAGDVTVKFTPERIDGDDAAFDVAFDTHSVELEVDIAAKAGLVVNGTAWTDAAWDGAGPGGHHRAGTLRFTAAGVAAGKAELTITGLPEPVRATWDLDDQ